jgi:hypothetical protein
MMITYHPHLKNIHNLKIVVLEIFRNSKYNFKMFKFQKSFAQYKLELKVVNIFNMIRNYDHFLKQNSKSSKIYTLLDNSYLFKGCSHNQMS